ncbi:tRNA pseudouridine(13) synthase TruD [Xanthomonas fragariae]|uniref:tRNA pseudouridine(13) synthase TruD n=1 Tax=Xanthomonas fragariae TaxID=48664 RepID=UPI001ABEBB66|nr:tRNA pseudouridine(13) synthase TruD [Xanthomonas fragariae]UKR51207.1 tRNA pseudouridine(13) synthase TruD [Xanthomonas fragariae]
MTDTSFLPRAHGAAVLSAAMRSTPEDFQVDELPAFEASGEGEHLLLTVRKRGQNTAYIARKLAQWAGIAEMGVSYAGLKDRHAMTTQRFSVHLPKRIAPDIATLDDAEMQVVDRTWHNRKLQRGALHGNRFVLTLRQVQGEHAAIEQRLQAIAARGIPNWFGEQRFGRDGANVASALAMFGYVQNADGTFAAAPASKRRLRNDQRSMLLSAARSSLFNRVLSARVEQGSWDAALEGEVWMLDGSRSVFGPEPWSEALAERLARFDIHPSGPLWGAGEMRSTDQAAAVEQGALANPQSEALRQGLEAAGLKHERRALRLRPQCMDYCWLDAQSLQIEFSLPPGCYATAVLWELGEVSDTGRFNANMRSEE